MTIIKDVEGEVKEREGYDNARAEDEEETGNEDEDRSDDRDCDNLLVVNSEHEEASEDEEKEILRESIRGGTEHMEGLISDLTQKHGGGSVLSNVDGSDVEQCLVADMIGASLEEDQNLVGNKSDEPYIKYVFHNKSLSDYDCAEYFLGSFSILFWTGKGDHLEKQSPHVSYSMWIRYLLNHHS